jgi:hypothetical protein
MSEYADKLCNAGFFVDDRLDNVFLDGEYVGKLTKGESELRIHATLTYPIKRIAASINAAKKLEEKGIDYSFTSARLLQLELSEEVTTKQNLLTRLKSLKIAQQ